MSDKWNALQPGASLGIPPEPELPGPTEGFYWVWCDGEWTVMLLDCQGYWTFTGNERAYTLDQLDVFVGPRIERPEGKAP